MSAFKKFFEKKIDVFKASFIFAIVFELFFNHIVYMKYIVNSVVIKHVFLYALVFHFVWSFVLALLFLLFSFNKYIFKTFVFIVLFLMASYSYYAYISFSSFKLNSLTLALVFDTNMSETSEFLEMLPEPIWLFLLKRVLFPLFLVIFLPIKYKKLKIKNVLFKFKNFIILHKKEIYAICFVILFAVVSKVIHRKRIIENMPLFDMSKVIFNTLKYRYNLGISLKNDKSVYTFNFVDNNDNDDLIVVLFMGESSRGDRWALNGYSRNTNPLLSKRKNIINFKNAHSCRLSSSLSFACIITGHNDMENFAYWPKGETILSFFKKAGFKTAYIAAGATDFNDMLEKDMSNTTLKMTNETFLNKYDKSYDDKLIMLLDDVLNMSVHKKHKNFIIMTSMGSHFNYKNRVPKQFQIFKTTDEKVKSVVINSKGGNCHVLNGKNLGDINDDYDATILFTDYVLDSVIEKLKDKNAIFIYASDHGESFGERGQSCLHCYDEPEVWHIPMFLWVSDKFKRKNPDKWHNIQKFQQQELLNKRMVSHDNIIHTLLDCSSVESEFVDKRFSMCSQTKEIYENKFEGCKRFKVGCM